MSRALALLLAAAFLSRGAARAEEPPSAPEAGTKAEAKDKAKGDAPRVFTNEDLAGKGGGDEARDGADAPPGTAAASPAEARAARAEETAAARTEARVDRKAERFRERAAQVQSRIDAARTDLDRLEADSDARNGDVEVASDGTRIQGIRPGRGYYLQLEGAKRRLAQAEAEMDRIRKDAAAAGVPQGSLP